MAIGQRIGRGRRQQKTKQIDREGLFDEDFLRQLELLQVIARRLIRGRQRAERKTKKLGSGLEFADHREYSPGDDIRNVDWGVLARLGTTLVRLYEEDQDLPLRIIVDVSDSMLTKDGHKLIYAQKIAAALAYVGLAGLDRVGMTSFSAKHHETLPAVRGKGRIFRIFDFLKNAKLGGPTSIYAGCKRVAAQSSLPGVTVVISDFYDIEGAFDGLNLLRFRKHEVVAIQVLDPIEANPMDSGLRGDVTLVDVEGEDTRDVTLSASMLQAYAEAHERFCTALENKCRARGMRFFRASIDEPFDELVLRIFRLGGVLR